MQQYNLQFQQLNKSDTDGTALDITSLFFKQNVFVLFRRYLEKKIQRGYITEKRLRTTALQDRVPDYWQGQNLEDREMSLSYRRQHYFDFTGILFPPITQHLTFCRALINFN